jgi:hypothetical protein
MKGKMELTIGICVGSSIVCDPFVFSRTLSEEQTANRHICDPLTGSRWMGVGFHLGLPRRGAHGAFLEPTTPSLCSSPISKYIPW